MERIASFCVDHTKLDRGMYLSRQDGDVLTWDIRMKKPNHGDYLSVRPTRWSTSSPPTPATASIRTASSTSAPWAAAPAFTCSPGA